MRVLVWIELEPFESTRDAWPNDLEIEAEVEIRMEFYFHAFPAYFNIP
jgi:hypothetical protein